MTLAYVRLWFPMRCRSAHTQHSEAGWTATNRRPGGAK
jgi:hypothetical protein